MSSERFSATYTVADGYANQRGRPHHFNIHASDVEDDMTDDDLGGLYEHLMQEHFDQNICPEEGNVSEFIAWARGIIESRAPEDKEAEEGP